VTLTWRTAAPFALAVFLALSSGAAARSSTSAAQIYFYANVGNPIGQNNPPLVRPSRLIIFLDGSWVIENLRWSGWGASVTHATGVGTVRRNGTSRSVAAQLTVSRPTLLFGRQVYSCFRLTIPSTPAANLNDCIRRAGSLYIYGPAGTTAAPATASPKTDVRFHTPSRNISCELFDDKTSHAEVACLMLSPQAVVRLSPSGRVTICQHQPQNRCTGNFGEGGPFRQLAYGSSTKAGRFRCSSETQGVTCVVIATGRGFLINRDGVTRV
jgi:hypothetical protein